MSLPLKTTPDDVRQIVGYLKNKPAGATTAEARAVLGAATLDGRKVSAYQTWDFLTKDGDRLKLTARGWQLARNPDEEQQVFRQVIDSIVPYRSVLEWIHHQKLDAVTTADVGSQWHEHHTAALGTDNETTIRDNVITFFHLADAAGLGTLTLGRRGQPTRLALDKGKLKEYVEAGPSAPPWTESVEESVAEEEPEDISPEQETPSDNGQAPIVEEPVAPPPPEPLRVFIAHGKNMEIVEQVQTMLELADIANEVAEEEETTAIPVPDKVFNAMKRCRAGIIAVSAEGKGDDLTINENVLIEIGAAFVLYDRRVVLLWDKRLPVPSNLQGLYRCEYEGDELSWSAGMKLMKAIQDFKR